MRPVLCLTVAFGVTFTLPALGQVSAPRDAIVTPRSAAQAGVASPHLAGRITAAGNGTPLRRASIAISVNGRVESKVLTDGDGQFDVVVPVSVSYAVKVSKAGYLPVSLMRPASASGIATLDVSMARSAVIYGRVTDPNGHPVTSIRVRIQRSDVNGIADVYAVTDDLGMFRASGLGAGRYSVATMGYPEYLNANDARALRAGGVAMPWQPSSDPVSVEVMTAAEYDASLSYRDVAVILADAPVGGTVTGQVTDETGEPAAGLSVRLLRVSGDLGSSGASSDAAPRVTDDRGRYRFFHVRPGRYAIVVTDESLQTVKGEPAWLPIYYPGTAAPADAGSLSIERNQELTGMDMVFTPTRGARVFGIALNAAGRPMPQSISLVAPGLEWPVVPQVRTAAVDEEGGFVFDDVPPGEYALRPARFASATVFAPIPGGVPGGPDVERQRAAAANPPEFAIQPVQVTDADTGPLLFRTAQPATLRGRIVFEGIAPPSVRFGVQAYTTDQRYEVSPGSGTGLVAEGTVDMSNATFEIPSVSGPVRLRLSAAPSDWWLKSAYAGTVNAAEFPVTVVNTNDSRDDITLVISGTAARLQGRTMRSASEGETGALVMVFSTNRERWFSGSPWLQKIHSNGAARYSASLPPGEYWVVALEPLAGDFGHRESDWADMLEPLTRSARRVTLGDGQTVTVDLSIATARN